MFEIFQYDFMLRAFAAGIAVAVIAPLIGAFLVVRRYSLMADTLAHVALLGAAFGFIFKIYPMLSAVLISIAAGLGIEKLRSSKRIPGDAALALFLSGSLAAAVVLMGIGRGFDANILSLLFGSIATVSPADLYFIAALSLASIIIVGGFYKELFLTSLDDELARANGIKAGAFNILLVALAALVVSLAIKIVGALLIGALMVVPVITAIQFKLGFGLTVLAAIAISLFSVLSGLFVSYYLGLASGGTVVIISLIIFLASLLFRPQNKTTEVGLQ
jgi:zinc transport system permease protein